MQDHKYSNDGRGGNPQDGMNLFKQGIRATGGAVGVIAILIGVVYAGHLLSLIRTLLSSTEETSLIANFAELLGGAELVAPTVHGPVPLAMPLAVLFFIVGLLIFGWLALGLIITGAKVVSYCLTDRKSIKELLTYAFGPKAKPEELISESVPETQR
jgi:hypothetical protein